MCLCRAWWREMISNPKAIDFYCIQDRQSLHSCGAALPARLSPFALRDQAKRASDRLLHTIKIYGFWSTLAFSTLLASGAWAQSMFDEASIEQAMATYFTKYEEVMTESQKQQASQQASPVLEQKWEDLARYATAVSKVFSASHGETFNGFILDLMAKFLDEPEKRSAITFFIERLQQEVEGEIRDTQNHRGWKSATHGAIEGFYILCALEMVRGLATKGKSALPKVQTGVTRFMSWVLRREAVPVAEAVAKEVGAGVAESTITALVPVGAKRAAQAGAELTFYNARRAGMRNFWNNFMKNPYFWEQIFGKTKWQRMFRFMAGGAALGFSHDMYSYHFLEQKFHPKKLFDMVQMVELLDTASRAWDLKNGIQENLATLMQDKERLAQVLENEAEKKAVLEKYSEMKEALQKIHAELQYFLTETPRFQSNISLGENLMVGEFLEALFKTYPEFQEIFQTTHTSETFQDNDNFSSVTHLSLEPIQVHLGQAAIGLQRFEQAMLPFYQRKE